MSSELLATFPTMLSGDKENVTVGQLVPQHAMSPDRPSRVSTTGSVGKASYYQKDEVVADGITRSRWADMCALIADGVKTGEACTRMNIKQGTYRQIMRDDKACQEQVVAARADWDNRNWPEELIEEICLRIALGDGQKKVAEELGFNFQAFHALRMRDEYVDGLYEKALKIQAEGLIDEAREIADDDKDDLCMGAKGEDKPNTAAVSRSKLKVSHRQWAATKLLRDRYGDVQKIEADINMTVDHAARLEEARKRKERAFREMKDVN